MDYSVRLDLYIEAKDEEDAVEKSSRLRVSLDGTTLEAEVTSVWDDFDTDILMFGGPPRLEFWDGLHVILTRAVERYPFFRVDAGETGIVTDTSGGNICVRMDKHIPGAEQWRNEIVWIDADEAREDLASNPKGSA